MSFLDKVNIIKLVLGAGLLRCGKSCRLRWMNYLRPDIKRGNITPDEDDLIIRMHSLLGNRWSLIAGRIPGRTDNEIKNYWNTHLCKKLRNQGTDPNTHKKLPDDPAKESEKKKKKRSDKRKKKKRAEAEAEKKREESESERNRAESEKKILVYLPKPTRVTSLSSIPRTDSTLTLNSINSYSAAASTSKEKEKEVNLEGENQNDDNGFGFFGEMECSSVIPDHGTLEKVYEEYLQLLKVEENHDDDLDSFAESLLA